MNVLEQQRVERAGKRVFGLPRHHLQERWGDGRWMSSSISCPQTAIDLLQGRWATVEAEGVNFQDMRLKRPPHSEGAASEELPSKRTELHFKQPGNPRLIQSGLLTHDPIGNTDICGGQRLAN